MAVIATMARNKTLHLILHNRKKRGENFRETRLHQGTSFPLAIHINVELG